MSERMPVAGRKSTVHLSEDWVAVILGAITLVSIVAGWVPSLPSLKWGSGAPLSRLFSPGVLAGWIAAGAVLWLLSSVAQVLQRRPVWRYTRGFAVVFVLAWFSQALAGHALSAAWGLEYVVFALVLGLLVSHLGGATEVVRAAAASELFIKTGLVIMGATILFSDVVQAGFLGLVQSVAVVIVVWYVAFWLASRFRVDDELAVMLSTAVSICGVSAAIAACGAIQGDRRKLSYITSLVVVVAVPMIVLMPWVARLWDIPDVVAGAWIGGTLDTTGSVVAAGALVSDTAMKIGTIVKFSQNVLIGVAALVLSVWWAMRTQQSPGGRSGVGLIWQRFPKFVLGFLAASLIFSFVMGPDLIARSKDAVASARTMWFALAFVSIGLEARVTDLVTFGQGRPLTAFLLAQSFNVLWTLALAWVIFGRVIAMAIL